MRFTIATLMLFSLAFAGAFAMVSQPNTTAHEIVFHLYVVSACTALVIAFHSTGKLQSYCLTFGVFAFGLIHLRSFPQTISLWIWENVTHDGPETAPAGNGDHFLVEGIVETTSSLLLSLFAASLVASFRRSSPVEQDDG